MKGSKVITLAGRRPIWQLLIASLCFTVAFYIFYVFVSNLHADLKGKQLNQHLQMLAPAATLIVFGTAFSMNKLIHFDISQKQFKIAYVLGFIKYGKWISINDFNYVSVFKQPLSNGSSSIDINVWYNTNKKIRVIRQNSKELAIKTAKDIARKLELDLLDATNANNHKWINTTKTASKSDSNLDR
ncbi:hypothetical protein [Ascidiimonas sp. W6]|uniref:hypothetical protein n=1 Tax=Ascidiimonas meishanensis TaxID=3128903 RepID=UPI0030ECDA7E